MRVSLNAEQESLEDCDDREAAELFFSWWNSKGEEDDSRWDGALGDDIDVELPSLSSIEVRRSPPSPLFVGCTATSSISLPNLDGGDDRDGELNDRQTIDVFGSDADGRDGQEAFPGNVAPLSGDPCADMSGVRLPSPIDEETTGNNLEQQQEPTHHPGACCPEPGSVGIATTAYSAADATTTEGNPWYGGRNLLTAENVAFGWLQQVRVKSGQFRVPPTVEKSGLQFAAWCESLVYGNLYSCF